MGETHVATHFIASGSTSYAFKVTSDRFNYILKLAAPNCGKTAAYESDFSLRSTIWEEGLPIARPIVTNQSLEIGIQATWAIDEYRLGSNPKRGSVAKRVSNNLGELLQVIHSIPVSGYGRLKNTKQTLQGIADDPDAGLLTRFSSPWPFSSDALENHPSVRVQPRLLKKIEPLKSDLYAFVRSGTPTIVHSDLHEGQLLESDGELSALLDFNEIMVGSQEWDLGSYFYFHGTHCFSDLLDGYTENRGSRIELTDKAFQAALLIALHHGNRGAVLKRPHRIQASVRFLESVLI